MTITLTQDYKKVTFTWNSDLTECEHLALGLNDNDFDFILKNKGHEGVNVEGWISKIS